MRSVKEGQVKGAVVSGNTRLSWAMMDESGLSRWERGWVRDVGSKEIIANLEA